MINVTFVIAEKNFICWNFNYFFLLYLIVVKVILYLEVNFIFIINFSFLLFIIEVLFSRYLIIINLKEIVNFKYCSNSFYHFKFYIFYLINLLINSNNFITSMIIT